MSRWSGERGLLFGSPLVVVYGIRSLWARVVSYYTRLFVNLTLRLVLKTLVFYKSKDTVGDYGLIVVD